ncbi:VOC family protein [Conexibacter stalactiti]|uniref:VOC family protein n=1 Tax=Conexibacter stalactiti TaxID=1940611 RepID=A0ABU4HQZ4_9ACTN|nr:VOC family protein [Conexibacter stalactiti]MDW5595692.1 VOC family protein [Conexibacter stalactiti]MEC5036334.1 VOC family protein [Conexibacter stalactiti]
MAATKTAMTTPAIVPILNFAHGRRTIDWLCEAFGFEPLMVVAGEDGHVGHCELALGRQLVMGGSAGSGTPYERISHPPGRAMLYVALDGGVREHCERARAAGAEIVLELEEKEYGGTDYTARDPEGNLWTFGSYVPEVPAA